MASPLPVKVIGCSCGTGVFVGGTGVGVGGIGVFVGAGVSVGGTGVLVGGTGVSVGGNGVLAYLLVQVLPVAAGFDGFHEDSLGSHER